MRVSGLTVPNMTACGDMNKSALFVGELVDCLRVPVVLSREDAVLLEGAFIALGAHTLILRATEHTARETMTTRAGEMFSIRSVMHRNVDRRKFHGRTYECIVACITQGQKCCVY